MAVKSFQINMPVLAVTTISLDCYTIDSCFGISVDSHPAGDYLTINDNNRFTYIFCLPEAVPFKKIQNDFKVQMARYLHQNVVILTQDHVLTVLKNDNVIEKIQNVKEFTVVKQSQHQATIIVLPLETQPDGLLILGCLSFADGSVTLQNIPVRLLYEESEAEKDVLFKYTNNEKSHSLRLIGSYLLDDCNRTAKIAVTLPLILDQLPISITMIGMQTEQAHQRIISRCGHRYLALVEHQMHLVDLQMQRRTNLQLASESAAQIRSNSHCLVWRDQFLLMLFEDDLHFYEPATGVLLAKLSVAACIQGRFQPTQSKNEQSLNKCKYNLLVDGEQSPSAQTIYILGKEELQLYKIQAGHLFESVSEQMAGIVRQFLDNHDKTHENIVRNLKVRVQMLQSTRKYLAQGMKDNSFGNCLRMLENEANLAVLNDCLLFTVPNLLQTQQTIQKEVEIALVRLCTKLVESKYEAHVENGLQLVVNICGNSKSIANLHGTKFAAEPYAKIVESKRVTKILKSSKTKKKLFELAYTLAIATKGLQFVASLEK